MSTASVSTVAIAGITGKLGTLAAENLLKSSSQVQIRGFCRHKSKVPAELRDNPRVSIVEGQSDDLDAARHAVKGSDVVICCYLGDDNLMINGQKLLIDAAVAEKVPRFVASDYTLDYRKLELGQLPNKDAMIHVKRYLDDQPIEGVHIMIGAFVETFWSFLQVFDGQNYALKYWGSGDEKWDLTTYGTSAQYMAAVSLDPTATGFLKFRGDFISLKEVAKLLEKRYGSPPELVCLGSMDQLRQRVDAARSIDNRAFDVLPLFYVYYIQNGQTLLGDVDNQRYPWVKPETMEDFLNANDVRSGDNSHMLPKSVSS
jgi:nucleoside-diphosphate-sugar epimerase